MPNSNYFDMEGYSRLDGELVDVKYEVHYKVVSTISRAKEYDHYEVITSINGIDKKHFTQEAIKEANDNIQDDIMSEIYEREE